MHFRLKLLIPVAQCVQNGQVLEKGAIYAQGKSTILVIVISPASKRVREYELHPGILVLSGIQTLNWD